MHALIYHYYNSKDNTFTNKYLGMIHGFKESVTAYETELKSIMRKYKVIGRNIGFSSATLLLKNGDKIQLDLLKMCLGVELDEPKRYTYCITLEGNFSESVKKEFNTAKEAQAAFDLLYFEQINKSGVKVVKHTKTKLYRIFDGREQVYRLRRYTFDELTRVVFSNIPAKELK